MKLKYCVTFILIGLPILAWADYPLEIIELKGRQLDEIIPVIKPLVGPDGTVTGLHNQLVIRTSPQRLQEIRNLLRKLDRPPRRLMIYVTQGRHQDKDLNQISTGTNLDLGNAKVTAGTAAPNNGARITMKHKRTSGRRDVTQQVQGLEGKPAFIATGTSYPSPYQSTTISGGVVQTEYGVDYRTATTGFYVVPRTNGQQISLELHSRLEKPGQVSGSFDHNRSYTTLSGQLGEWIAVGGTNDRDTRQTSAILSRGSTSDLDTHQIFLMVEEIP